VTGKMDRVAGDDAFRDCVSIIQEEHDKKNQSDSETDLLALQSRLKSKKGYGGK